MERGKYCKILDTLEPPCPQVNNDVSSIGLDTISPQVVCEASVQAPGNLRCFPHLGDPHRVPDLSLLPRVSHLRSLEALQGLGLPRDAGPGAPLPHH